MITEPLVDSHCHLDFADFQGQEESYLAAMEAQHVGWALIAGVTLERFPGVLALVERFPNLYAGVGVHPDTQQGQEPDVATLCRLAEHPKVVAIGEAGLDYHYKHSSPAGQAEGFRNHIAAARETGLPPEIHTREADADTLAILEDEHAKGPFPAVLHCYTGGRELALRAVDLGLYVSFSGVISFKKTEALQAIAREVPIDRVLVETDAPFLAPVPYRGKTNEPAYVAHTAAALARIRGLTESEIAAATTENFFRLYTKARRPAAPESAPA